LARSRRRSPPAWRCATTAAPASAPSTTRLEKFIQTLKEQLLWIERFDTHEQLRAAVRGFARRYNEHWLLERHGYHTPIEARQHLLAQAAQA
jgi:hypothetical protein